MLDDITGVGSGAVEVGFFSDGFPQSNDSEERIVQFMPDSGGESSGAAPLLRPGALVLGRAPEDRADPILSLISSGHVEPLIVISPGANLNLLSVAWFHCACR